MNKKPISMYEKSFFIKILCIPKSAISLRMWYILLHSTQLYAVCFIREKCSLSQQNPSNGLCKIKRAFLCVILGQISR